MRTYPHSPNPKSVQNVGSDDSYPCLQPPASRNTRTAFGSRKWRIQNKCTITYFIYDAGYIHSFIHVLKEDSAFVFRNHM
jgi:hypothetical protein